MREVFSVLWARALVAPLIFVPVNGVLELVKVGVPVSIFTINLLVVNCLWARACRSEATGKVAVPEEVVNLLSDVRSFLQEKCEPPVYVSDRRLVKALALLQVCCIAPSLLHQAPQTTPWPPI